MGPGPSRREKETVGQQLANHSTTSLACGCLLSQDHCPSGDIDRETFERLVSEMHRVAVQDVRRYADMVFDLFDKDRSNSISFDEYVCFLSLASKGTREEKLSVVFKTHGVFMGAGHDLTDK